MVWIFKLFIVVFHGIFFLVFYLIFIISDKNKILKNIEDLKNQKAIFEN